MTNVGRVLCLEAVVAVLAAAALASVRAGTVEPPETLGEPLFLTPLLRANRLQDCRNYSLVNSFHGYFRSHAGYLTVNEEHESNLFFFFVPAEINSQTAPLLLWLNGGPGNPSLIGAFNENGPIKYSWQTTGIHSREHAWTKHFSMLYIDSPVGTGYSFTRHEDGYPTTLQDVSEDLYSALTQFFQIFPTYSRNDFYVGGQSYAGKYVPSLARYIHDRNQMTGAESPAVHMRLTGLYMGGAMCDPKTMLPVYGDQLYNFGFISKGVRQAYKETVKAVFDRGYIDNIGQLMAIFNHADPKVTAIGDFQNLLGWMSTNEAEVNLFENKLYYEPDRLLNFRQMLNVGNISRPAKFMVMSKLLVPDWFLNTTAEHSFLMERYKVLHYTGNLDMLVGPAMTEAFLDTVEWSGKEAYRQASRQKWFVGDKLAGWVVQEGLFTRVIVRNAGHMVPFDQPESALEMMKSFIFGDPFSTTAS